MVNEFCGFKHGVIGTDKMPADTTLNNMKKADLIKLLHTAQHNYETLMWFYNNAVKANMSQLNNNGWIPVSDKLPDSGVSVIVSYKDRFLSQADGTCEGWYDATNMIWHLTDYEYSDNVEVIAWREQLAPYQPKGE